MHELASPSRSSGLVGMPDGVLDIGPGGVMAVDRSPSGSSLIDILDRVLDKGIVIDAWDRLSLVGVDLVAGEARLVVNSIETYVTDVDAVGISQPASRPHGLAVADELKRVQPENADLRRRLGQSSA